VTPSQIRTELLRQHHEIRLMVEKTRETARRVWNGVVTRAELDASITRLADRLRIHNRYEEDLLREILPTVDAWGRRRAEILQEQPGEHRKLLAALVEVSATIDSMRFNDVVSPLDRLLEHMDREEQACLAEDVLRDDSVVPDQLDG
jgi:hypothetical protein